MSVSMQELHKLRVQMINQRHEMACEMPEKTDMIDRPPHYTATRVEPIDVIEAWGLGFHLGNCLKYIARCDLKGRPIEDLEKARWYLDREISRRRGDGSA